MTNSNTILEITQDIYAIGGEFSNLTDQFLSMEVNKQNYDKQCYIIACKINYLQSIVNIVKSKGYKFMRYEKEIELLNILADEVSNIVDLKNVNILTEDDMESVNNLIYKYKNLVNIDEIMNEFTI